VLNFETNLVPSCNLICILVVGLESSVGVGFGTVDIGVVVAAGTGDPDPSA